VEKLFSSLFPIFFIAMWLGVTTILSAKSGWFRLVREYPDRPESALRKFSFISGSMGMVSMRGMLTLQACPSGLRVGMFRLFGPFSRNFLVPWNEIHVERTDSFFLGKVAELEFGRESKLRVAGYVADELARAVPGHWPELGHFSREPISNVLGSLAKRWLLLTAPAATFFILVPRLAFNGHGPPIVVAILFPAIVMFMGLLPEVFRRLRD
jgi:hypothetical protein